MLALLARYKVTAETSRGQGDGAPGGTERKVSVAAEEGGRMLEGAAGGSELEVWI